MGAGKQETGTARTAKPRATPAERRAAEVATLSTRQAELKHEAEERRRERELREKTAAVKPPATKKPPAG